MQAARYLTATRGLAAPEDRICYERAEPLCHSLGIPLLLYVPLIGQWRYSLMTDKLTATMQIAKRVYSLAQKQNDPALMLGGHRALVSTHFFLGDFEAARKHAIRVVQIWRSGRSVLYGRALSASRHLFVLSSTIRVAPRRDRLQMLISNVTQSATRSLEKAKVR